MICKCGKQATYKAKVKIKRGDRVLFPIYHWCDDCLALEREKGPLVAVRLTEATP